MKYLIFYLAWISSFSHFANANNLPHPLSSPNGRATIEYTEQSGMPFYSVSFKGQTIIDTSRLGFIVHQHTWGSGEFELLSHSQTQHNEEIAQVIGKTSRIASNYNQQTLQLKAKGKQPFRLNIIMRAYNNGVALRYHIPPQAGINKFTIEDELTEFNFPKNYGCFGLNLGKYVNSHEGEYDAFAASSVREHHLYHSPVVCKTGDKKTTFALAESNVKNYPGAWYRGKGNGELGLRTRLTPLTYPTPEEVYKKTSAYISIENQGVYTPWRVIMLGDTPGALTESTLIYELAEPSMVKDQSWIKPGKVAWDWWNNNQVAVANPGMNTATYLAYIDFAATLGLEYILIDEGWHQGSHVTSKPGSDLLKPIAAMDIPKILRYAESKNVGVWLWVQWQQLDWQMEEALAAYQKWGVKGIKVDFMDRYDQPMVNYYHKLLKTAAKYKIMVDMHGAYSPNGLARTYPHYLTQEGVLGAEYNKWSNRITATHNVTLPFTRMILGPIDYTPGGFKHVAPGDFATYSKYPHTYVNTTRGQALAMFVVYDSPLQMLADSPINYSKTDGIWPQPKSEWQEGLEFIQQVPVTWDETLVLQGDIGEFIVMARRKGEQWYIGAMTNESKRKLSIPLHFLSEGQYTATIWQDGKTISSLNIQEKLVSAKSKLILKLAGSGGAVVSFTPN